MADQLCTVGIMPTEICAVGDTLETLVATLARLANSADLLIMSGGLGPTDGDLTRAALAELLGEALITDPAAHARLTAWLAARGRTMNERQARQGQRPPSASCLDNNFGTAPGLHLTLTPGNTAGRITRRCEVFCLPGPPGELKPMFAAAILPALRPARTVITRLLHIIGIPEADLAARLAASPAGKLTDRNRVPLIGMTASGGVITLRMRFEAELASESRGIALLDNDEATLRAMFGDHLFAKDAQTIQHTVLAELLRTGATLYTAESCTGGLLGTLLTDIPGSSASYAGGWVTYSNEMKAAQLGVDAGLINRCGAVSAEVATAMAMGAMTQRPSAHSAKPSTGHTLAITGIAGPEGGSEAKPVGTVYIAHAWQGDVSNGSNDAAGLDVRRFCITGGRDEVRQRAARTALAMLHFQLRGHPPGQPKLLWQI